MKKAILIFAVTLLVMSCNTKSKDEILTSKEWHIYSIAQGMFNSKLHKHNEDKYILIINKDHSYALKQDGMEVVIGNWNWENDKQERILFSNGIDYKNQELSFIVNIEDNRLNLTSFNEKNEIQLYIFKDRDDSDWKSDNIDAINREMKKSTNYNDEL